MKRLICFVLIAVCSAVAQTPQYVSKAGGTMHGPLVAAQVNGVFNAGSCSPTLAASHPSWCSGSDASGWINAANTAAIAAGGGIVDATMLGGDQTMSATINVGSATSFSNGIAITLLLPTNGVWTWGLTGGTACGIKQYDSTTILGHNQGGGGVRMLLDSAAGANMDSLYCNVDPGGGGYFRAEGFGAKNTGAGTFVNGLIHVTNADDESSFEYIYAENDTGDAWHVDAACCGASFSHVQGITSASGGIPLTIGAIYVLRNATWTNGSTTVTATAGSLTNAQVGKSVLIGGAGSGIPGGATVATVTSVTSFTLSTPATNSGTGPLRLFTSSFTGPVSVSLSDSTFNAPKTGLPNVVIGGNGVSGIQFRNVYLEGNQATDTTSPFVYIDQSADNVYFYQLYTVDFGTTTKYAIENHTTLPWGVWGLHSSSGINDAANGVIVPVFGNAPFSGIMSYAPNSAGGAPLINLVPDSAFRMGGAYWSVGGYTATAAAGPAGDAALVYTGNGSGSGNVNAVATLTGLAANTQYAFSAWVDASNSSGGNAPHVYACQDNACATIWTSIFQTVGNKGYITGTFTTPVGVTTGYLMFSSANTTVANTKTLAFAEPQVNLGTSVLTYQPTALGSVSTPSAGINGNTDGSAAGAGTLGQVVNALVAVGSGVSLTTATPANVASISLTAGDWEVWGNCNFSASSATTAAGALWTGGINTTSATIPADGAEGPVAMPAVTTTSFLGSTRLGGKQINVNTTTTVYLVCEATFSAGTVKGYGKIEARRMR